MIRLGSCFKNKFDPNGCLCRMSHVNESLFDDDQLIDTTVLGKMFTMKELAHK